MPHPIPSNAPTVRRREDGVIHHGVPVSTLEPLALERGQMQVPLLTPMMSCYERVCLSDFLREEGRLKFFCRREAQISSHESSACAPPRLQSILSCQDDLFGVEVTWPSRLKARELHRFLFIGSSPPAETKEPNAAVDDSHLPDRILINGRLAWTRSPGSALAFIVDYVPEADDFPVLTLLKNRAFTFRANPSRFCPSSVPPHHPILRLLVHLSLDTAVLCEHHGGSHAPSSFPPFPLPGEFRRFLSPGPFAFPQDFDPPDWREPPLEPPPYPTDPLFIHDLADRYANQNVIEPYPERRAQLNQLCLENGILLFDPDQADWLESKGFKDSDRIAFLVPSYFLRAHPNDEAQIQADIRSKRELCCNLLLRFPNAHVFVRLVEYSGCQFHSAGLLPSGRNRVLPSGETGDWFAYAEAADTIYREIHEAAFGEPRRIGGRRFAVFANIQMLNYLSARAFRGGADFTMDKTIGRESVNLIVACSRGHNRAYGSSWIGMQHDSWGGLRFNYDGAIETEYVWRAFFFGGANVMDRETEYVGVRKGRVVPNRKGQAFLRVVRWMNRHPRRGRPRVKIAFWRGSESMAGWGYPFYAEKEDPGLYGADPFRPKEYADWNLLSVVFPAVLTDGRRDNARWMTGTPFGPCDIIPWDTPASRLADYGVIIQIGENVFENDRQIEALAEAVRQGLTFVCSLSLFYGNRWNGSVYTRHDLSALAGVELGPDIPLWTVRSPRDTVSNTSRHYNRLGLKGATVVDSLPNGDPWIVEHRMGKGRVVLVSTDRLTDLGFEPIAERIRQLLAPLAPLRFTSSPHSPNPLGAFHPLRIPLLSGREKVTFAGTQPAEGFWVNQSPSGRADRTCWFDISVFEKGPIRLIGIQDYGRARVPTDNGPDFGPWSGQVQLNLTSLNLETIQTLELYHVDPTFHCEPIPFNVRGTLCEFPLTLDGFTELIVGPRGETKHHFFYGS